MFLGVAFENSVAWTGLFPGVFRFGDFMHVQDWNLPRFAFLPVAFLAWFFPVGSLFRPEGVRVEDFENFYFFGFE